MCASGIWIKSKGQVPKFTCRNTVTSSRTLVKSHKGLQRDSPKAVLEKSCHKNFPKYSPKRNYYAVLSPVDSQPTTSLKKNPMTVIFWWLLKRFYFRTLVKEQKKLKYSPYVLKQSWSEEFHTIHPKETVMKSYFS